MNGFKPTDPDIWEKRSGGGCLILFGLPFLAAGLALTFGFLRPEGAEMPPLFVSLFGIPFALAGAFLIFGRAGLTIDRRLKKVTKWYGLLVPFKRTVFYLDRFDRITIKREVRRSDKSSYTVFAVRLDTRVADTSLGEVQAESLIIVEPRDYTAGRRSAEELAKFLELPLHDSSGGSTIVREPDKLDVSIKEQAWHSGKKFTLPELPPDMISVITDVPDGTEILIPKKGVSSSAFLALIPGLLFSAAIFYFFIYRSFADRMSESLVFIAFFIFFFVLLPTIFGVIAIVSRGRKQTRVTISSDRLRVEIGGGRKAKTTEIPAIEIEEVTLAAMPGKTLSKLEAFKMNLSAIEPITIRSDTVELSFGKGLSANELRYLHALIMKKLTE